MCNTSAPCSSVQPWKHQEKLPASVTWAWACAQAEQQVAMMLHIQDAIIIAYIIIIKIMKIIQKNTLSNYIS